MIRDRIFRTIAGTGLCAVVMSFGSLSAQAEWKPTESVEIMVHSNLDDGFAALFTDLACSLGAILIEQYIVDELLGGHVGHCFGNTFSRPYTRLAFQRASHKVLTTPGTGPKGPNPGISDVIPDVGLPPAPATVVP